MNEQSPPSLATLAENGQPKKRKYTRKAQAFGTVVIEKNVPLPPPTANNKYPWHEIEVGDSFFVPNGPKSIFGACSKRTKEGPRGFIARNVERRGVKGVRVWRTK